MRWASCSMARTFSVASSTSVISSRTLLDASSTTILEWRALSLATWVMFAVCAALRATSSAVELISVMAVTA